MMTAKKTEVQVLAINPNIKGKLSQGYYKQHQTNGNRVLQCFLNADLRNGHEGLEKLAKDNGIDVTKLLPGQYVVFINSSKDKIKLYATNHVIAYYKLEKGRIYDPRVIAEIPKAFNGHQKLDMDVALKNAITKALARRQKQRADLAIIAKNAQSSEGHTQSRR